MLIVAGKWPDRRRTAELERALNDHELIKVQFRLTERDDRRAPIDELASVGRCELVQVIGKMALIYRKNPKPNKNPSNIQPSALEGPPATAHRLTTGPSGCNTSTRGRTGQHQVVEQPSVAEHFRRPVAPAKTQRHGQHETAATGPRNLAPDGRPCARTSTIYCTSAQNGSGR